MFTGLCHKRSPFNITLGIMYLLIILAGIFGNFLVVFIAYRNKEMHTTTNYLLCNLAVADFMSLVFCSIPMAVNLSNIRPSRLAGQFICKTLTGSFLSQMTKCAAFISLIFLATDRYYAITVPLNDTRFRLRKSSVGFAIGFSWTAAVMFCFPFVVWSDFNEESNRCLDPWAIEKASSMKPYIMTVALTFVGATCLLMYCYVQILRGIYITKTVCAGNIAAKDQTDLAAKKKLAATSVSVTVGFCACFSPSVFFQLYLALESAEKVKLDYDTLYVVHCLARFILYLGSSLNPLFYAFQSSSYRKNLFIFSTKKITSTVGVAVPVGGIEMDNVSRTVGALSKMSAFPKKEPT